mgnify:CR=1 FL=1
MDIIKRLAEYDHEQLVYFNDVNTDIKGIIAIHNTYLGPSLGGCRMWNYTNEQEALNDVLRLSRAMTYKAAVAGLNLGGGKAVIIGDAKKQKSMDLFQVFGRVVNSLGGRYITAEDVGTNEKDMEVVYNETRYVTGIPKKLGGSGDPSPFTAYGVYMGMLACVKEKLALSSMNGLKVLVQGAGNVGMHLIDYLYNDEVELYVSDIDIDRCEYIKNKYNATIINPSDVFNVDVDIYAPCALGAVINEKSISQLKCDIIAGAANNQLFDENRDSELLSERNIIYAPDFLINAGGLINVYSEIKGYDREHALNQTKEIYNTTLEILRKAEIDCVTTHNAALSIAQQRIVNKRRGL